MTSTSLPPIESNRLLVSAIRGALRAFVVAQRTSDPELRHIYRDQAQWRARLAVREMRKYTALPCGKDLGITPFAEDFLSPLCRASLLVLLFHLCDGDQPLLAA